MFEQDYIMRLIKEMIRMALKLMFHIDAESQAAELLEENEERETLNRLLDLVDGAALTRRRMNFMICCHRKTRWAWRSHCCSILI